MREREARNAEEIKKQNEKAGRREKRLAVENKGLFLLCYQKCTVFSCEANMKTAEDCLYPLDGGSLHSLIWLWPADQ